MRGMEETVDGMRKVCLKPTYVKYIAQGMNVCISKGMYYSI